MDTFEKVCPSPSIWEKVYFHPEMFTGENVLSSENRMMWLFNPSVIRSE